MWEWPVSWSVTIGSSCQSWELNELSWMFSLGMLPTNVTKNSPIEEKAHSGAVIDEGAEGSLATL